MTDDFWTKPWKPKKKRGPKPGNRPYDAADRKLFKKLERLTKSKRMSLWAAALSLAEEGKLAGHGTPQSRAKRLCKAYRRDLEEEEKWRAFFQRGLGPNFIG